MKRRNFLFWLGMGTVVSNLPLIAGQGTEKALSLVLNEKQENLFAPLQAAYQDSANSHARYLAFAGVATQENHLEAAELFKAAALGEQIHCDNHSKVLQELGVLPEFKAVAPQVGSTLENLSRAIATAAQEQNSYTQLLQQAKAIGNTSVVTTLEEALEGKTSRAILYQEVKSNLLSTNEGGLPRQAGMVAGAIASKADSSAGAGTKAAFYVCSVCGYTARAIPETCPQCGADASQFQAG